MSGFNFSNRCQINDMKLKIEMESTEIKFYWKIAQKICQLLYSRLHTRMKQTN